ncbi:type 4a pilus biogenesis protein PilO [Aeoliella mucimassa]|uniref:Pilus assembly protein, PilO n=1 Tax=Aeoliella mucimassa TaxID=2527972 RepID=A0A518AJ81_9BACT|nr:type 4a pilus biogenesis protein PilO [Aeoliella mucimassa]QDU54770.1 Pilus assembly protein, PilO [Aeoliella mucimassa]
MNLPDDRRMLRLLTTSIGAAVWGVLVLGYYGLYHVPLHNRESEHRERIANLSVLLNDNTNVHAMHRQLRETKTHLEDQIAGIRRRIPISPLEAQFLSETTKLASQHRVIIDNFRRQEIASFKDYSEVDVVISGRGSYSSVCQFLHGVNQLERLSTVRSMSLKRSDVEGVYPFEVVYSLQFGIQTDLEPPAEEQPL